MKLFGRDCTNSGDDRKIKSCAAEDVQRKSACIESAAQRRF